MNIGFNTPPQFYTPLGRFIVLFINVLYFSEEESILLHRYSEMFSAFTTSNVLAIRKASLLLNIFQMFSSPNAFLKDGTKRVYYCSEMVWY